MRTLFLSFLFLSLPLLAATPNLNAPKGGTFVRNLQGEPPTLHPIMASDYYAFVVHDYVLDSLADRDLETSEFKPRLAESWEISKDGKIMTFHLRKDVKFHDGQPLTAEDVKFSFDAVYEKAYAATHWYSFFESIDKIEVVDPLTIKFTLKNTYFQNFLVIASFHIIPKHIYSDVEKSKKMTRELIGSGPYKLEKFDRGQRIVLKRNDEWFGNKLSEWKGYQNFDSVVLRFVKEEAIAMDMMKKGEIDFHYPLSLEYYEQKAIGEPWGKTIFRNKVENLSPKSSSFIGWNLRRSLFKEKNVRLALAHLMNREEMNKKFRFGYSYLSTGPNYVQSEYASPSVKPISFDPKEAQKLLSKAGWKDTNKDGTLDKEIDGKRVEFKFTLLHSNKDFEKYLAMYKDELKKAGIDMEIKYIEWNSFLRLLDEGNFDAVTLRWSGTPEWDPKPIWHSQSATAGGSNFIGYKNPEVDKLIDEARFEMEKKPRLKKLRKVYELIAADAPYLFMFDDRYEFYANSSKIEKPAETFKYDIGTEYWWSKR